MMSGLFERFWSWVVPPGDPAAPVEPFAVAEPARRRDRAPTPAERQLAEAISLKLLHGWLQNRHQTLMPMSMNLTRYSTDDRERIARFAALAVLAGIDRYSAARLSTWLAAAGADAATLATYEAALTSPPHLDRALADVAEPQTASIAYVLALVAAQTGEAGSPGHAFAEYVAARLTLPSAAVRSAQRRYRS